MPPVAQSLGEVQHATPEKEFAKFRLSPVPMTSVRVCRGDARGMRIGVKIRIVGRQGIGRVPEASAFGASFAGAPDFARCEWSSRLRPPECWSAGPRVSCGSGTKRYGCSSGEEI